MFIFVQLLTWALIAGKSPLPHRRVTPNRSTTSSIAPIFREPLPGSSPLPPPTCHPEPEHNKQHRSHLSRKPLPGSTPAVPAWHGGHHFFSRSALDATTGAAQLTPSPSDVSSRTEARRVGLSPSDNHGCEGEGPAPLLQRSDDTREPRVQRSRFLVVGYFEKSLWPGSIQTT